MKAFVSNYHISVNDGLVDDLTAIGIEVIMPDAEFGKQHINFFAPNDTNPKAHVVDYAYFRYLEEPIVIIIPCIQMIDDFMQLYKDRGERDVIVYLTANSDSANEFLLDGSDYLISHDLHFHRQSKAKYKILYFNRPLVNTEKKTYEELRKSFDEKKLKLYINNFDKEGFEPEYAEALNLRSLWLEKTGYTIPFYGYDMPDGWLSHKETHEAMKDSMFTVVFKRRETWGQMVNESMLIGTPCIFLNKFIHSTFEDYLITKDTAIKKESVKAIVSKVFNMSFEQYETIVNESYSQSQMYCNDQVRQDKLTWLFSKIASDKKMV